MQSCLNSMSIMAVYLLLIFFMNVFSLTKQKDLAPPTLTAHPSVITETDRVHLNCQPPPSVSVSRCYFFTTEGQSWSNSSCVQSVRGSDLLMENQNPPVQVKLHCYYLAISASKHSDQTAVTVHLQSMKPQISLQLYDKEVIVLCSSTSTSGSECNLYFGESTQPYSTNPSRRRNDKTLFCQFFISGMDFVTNLNKVQRKVVSCDYTLENEPSSLSPRSEPYDLTDFMIRYNSTQLHVTTASTDPQHTGRDSEAVAPEIGLWVLTLSSSCGFVMGSVLTILGVFCWIKGKRIVRVSQDIDPDSRTMEKREIQNEDDEVEATGPYMPLNKASDVYATIHHQPTATPTENFNLSTV